MPKAETNHNEPGSDSWDIVRRILQSQGFPINLEDGGDLHREITAARGDEINIALKTDIHRSIRVKIRDHLADMRKKMLFAALCRREPHVPAEIGKTQLRKYVAKLQKVTGDCASYKPSPEDVRLVQQLDTLIKKFAKKLSDHENTQKNEPGNESKLRKLEVEIEKSKEKLSQIGCDVSTS